MPTFMRCCLGLLILSVAPRMEVVAQAAEQRDQPKILVRARPLTQQELNRRRALTLYGLGMMRVKEDRLVEATHVLEDALELDAESAAIQKALIPLYLAFGRMDDAVQACKRTLDLDPGDHDTWSVYARQLKNRGKLNEAREAVARALACKSVAERLDLRVQLQYSLGSLCEETERFDQALAAFAEVVKGLESAQAPVEMDGMSAAELKQQAAGTSERMIKLCIQARQYNRAIQLFAEAEKNYPLLGRRLSYNLAKVYAAQGHEEKALTSLDAYLKTQPPGAEPYEFRIRLLKQLHREGEIVSSLKTFSELDSKNVALRLLLANQAALAGQWQEAEQIYQVIAAEAPTAEIYRGLFNVWRTRPDGRGMDKVLSVLDDAITRSTPRKGKRKEGDPQAAVQARAMLLALREDAALARSLLPAGQQAIETRRALEQQTQYFLAILAQRLHQLNQAEFFFRSCVEENTDPQREPAVYGGLLQVLWLEHKYDAMIEVCRQGIRRSKTANQPLFYERLPRALVLLGRTGEALAEADKGVEIASDETRLMFRLLRLWVLGRAGRTGQAVAEAAALLKEYHRPGDVRDIRVRLYELYTDSADWSRAEEQLQLILKADPSDALANNNLGYLWAEQGKNLEEAERLIRKAIDLTREQSRGAALAEQEETGENAAYLDSLGWVLFRRGQLPEAKRWLEHAAALRDGADDPTVWEHLGDLYRRLEEPARARTAWQKALVLYEAERQRKVDDHRRDVEHKLKLLDEDKHLGK